MQDIFSLQLHPHKLYTRPNNAYTRHSLIPSYFWLLCKPKSCLACCLGNWNSFCNWCSFRLRQLLVHIRLFKLSVATLWIILFIFLGVVFGSHHCLYHIHPLGWKLFFSCLANDLHHLHLMHHGLFQPQHPMS